MSTIAFPEKKTLPPLYPTICGAIRNDGTLPRDFSLPRPAPEDAENKLRFADGAFDGIALYHMQPDKRDITSLTEIVGLLHAGSYEKADECLGLFFSIDDYISMLPLVEDLQKWIFAHREQLDAGHIYEGALYLLKNSAHIEAVKFALTCLELLAAGGANDQRLRNLTRVMALSDEFTLFSLFLMRQWPDSSEIIFDAARHVFGWGRIHAVSMLEPTTDEMRRWLLTDGWRNDIMPAYSALLCVQKSGLSEKLADGSLSDAELTAAGELLPHLLEDGPVAGIAALENADDFLNAYLSEAERRASCDSDFQAVEALLAYEQGRDIPKLDRITRCRALLTKKKTETE